MWQRGVGVGGREDKEAGFKKETGQQAQRDPGGLSIDKWGWLIHHIASGGGIVQQCMCETMNEKEVFHLEPRALGYNTRHVIIWCNRTVVHVDGLVWCQRGEKLKMKRSVFGAFSTKRRAPRASPSFLLQTRTKSSGVHAERVLWTLISTLRCFAQYTGVLISAVRRANINKGCKDCVDIVASLISVDPNGFIFGGMNPDLPKNYCIHFCYKTQGGVNTSFTLSPQLFWHAVHCSMLTNGCTLHSDSLSIHILWSFTSFGHVDIKELHVSFGAVEIYCKTVLIFN